MPSPALFASGKRNKTMKDIEILGSAIIEMLLLIPRLLFKLLVTMTYGYRNHLSKLGPREAALAEASHGAAMIVLPVLVLLRHGDILPSWSPLAALALMICGGFRLFNG